MSLDLVIAKVVNGKPPRLLRREGEGMQHRGLNGLTARRFTIGQSSGEQPSPNKDFNGELLEELEATQAFKTANCANYSNAAQVDFRELLEWPAQAFE